MDIAEAQRFVFNEAQLLDDRRFDEWLELFSEDCVYWMPGHPGADPTRETSIIYDERSTLEDRVTRMQSPATHAQIPPTSTRRLISNICLEAADKESHIEIRASFAIYANRLRETRSFAGGYLYRLVDDGRRVSIKEKRIDLLGSEDFLGNITFVW